MEIDQTWLIVISSICIVFLLLCFILSWLMIRRYRFKVHINEFVQYNKHLEQYFRRQDVEANRLDHVLNKKRLDKQISEKKQRLLMKEKELDEKEQLLIRRENCQ